jgi:phosphoglycolate phosphatase
MGGRPDGREMLEEFRRRYWKRPTPEGAVVSGAAWTIGVLASRGIKLGVCSNKPEAFCRKILAETRLSDFFDVIVGGDSTPQPKPSPEPLAFAAQEMAVGLDAVVLVGDSTIDQRASNAAGIPFVFYSGGYDDGVDTSLARIVVSDLRQIVGGVIPA